MATMTRDPPQPVLGGTPQRNSSNSNNNGTEEGQRTDRGRTEDGQRRDRGGTGGTEDGQRTDRGRTEDGRQQAVGCGKPVVLEHTMAVEWIQWKRQFIMDNHPDLKHMFADAADFENERPFCDIHGYGVPVPAVDILSFGFSCKELSTLRDPHYGSTDRVVAEGTGSSGKTARYGMAYVSKFRTCMTACVLTSAFALHHRWCS